MQRHPVHGLVHSRAEDVGPGDFDVILLVRASDARDLRRIVLEDIQAIPAVRSTRTTRIFEDFAQH